MSVGKFDASPCTHTHTDNIAMKGFPFPGVGGKSKRVRKKRAFSLFMAHFSTLSDIFIFPFLALIYFHVFLSSFFFFFVLAINVTS
jgi:hypothetical protein